VLTGSYQGLFATIAGSSATLTGLLFVAVSLSNRSSNRTSHVAVVNEVRASAALLAFTSALAVSLYGLVPGNNVGYPAVTAGVIGIVFTAAGMRSILGTTKDRRLLSRQLGLFVLLLTVFGFELAGGVRLLVDRHNAGALDMVSDVLIASLLVGVARAWELVGNRDTGLFASIATLSGRDPGHRDNAPHSEDTD
jgi:hypothetical protein